MQIITALIEGGYGGTWECVKFILMKPWVIKGVFNYVLNLEDTYFGSSEINISMWEFKECVTKIEVWDVNSTGLYFIWNQEPKAEVGMLKKIGRVMSNLNFTIDYLGSYLFF